MVTFPSSGYPIVSPNWRFGWALDVHTRSSRPLTDGRFDTERTEVGELLYGLKYQGRLENADELAEAAAAFLRSRYIFASLAAIIPVPPSDTSRSFQPVEAVAIGLGELTGIPVLTDLLLKVHPTDALKDITDPEERRRQLAGAFQVRDRRLAGKSVLVFDDLYRSGETLSAVCNVLVDEGGVPRRRVYVLTLTKTRTIR
jgi:predicted amidophosphoribosyltransferase